MGQDNTARGHKEAESRKPQSCFLSFLQTLGKHLFCSVGSGKIFLMNQEVKLKTFGGTRPFKGQERYTERRGPHDLTVLATTGWMYQG